MWKYPSDDFMSFFGEFKSLQNRITSFSIRIYKIPLDFSVWIPSTNNHNPRGFPAESAWFLPAGYMYQRKFCSPITCTWHVPKYTIWWHMCLSSELQNCQSVKIHVQTSTTISRLRKTNITQQTPSHIVIVADHLEMRHINGLLSIWKFCSHSIMYAGSRWYAELWPPSISLLQWNLYNEFLIVVGLAAREGEELWSLSKHHM